MTKPEFIDEVAAIATAYNESAQGQEDKQTYLDDLTNVLKGYTGEKLPVATTWPC